MPAYSRLGWAPGETPERGLEGGSEVAATLQLTYTEPYLTSPSCVSGLRPFLDPPSAFPTPSPGVRVRPRHEDPRLSQGQRDKRRRGFTPSSRAPARACESQLILGLLVVKLASSPSCTSSPPSPSLVRCDENNLRDSSVGSRDHTRANPCNGS